MYIVDGTCYYFSILANGFFRFCFIRLNDTFDIYVGNSDKINKHRLLQFFTLRDIHRMIKRRGVLLIDRRKYIDGNLC